jgi:hypothetical protein
MRYTFFARNEKEQSGMGLSCTVGIIVIGGTGCEWQIQRNLRELDYIRTCSRDVTQCVSKPIHRTRSGSQLINRQRLKMFLRQPRRWKLDCVRGTVVVLEERCVLPGREAVVCTARCSGSNRKTNWTAMVQWTSCEPWRIWNFVWIHYSYFNVILSMQY